MAESEKKSRKGSAKSWTFVDGFLPESADLPALQTPATPPTSRRKDTDSNALPAGAIPSTVPIKDGATLTVSDLTSRIRGQLEGSFDRVRVTGEVTGARPASSGHRYFSLKDSGAFLNCVLWSRDAAQQKHLPQDGQEIVVDGRLTVYEPRGQYQLVVSHIEPAGLGRLHAEFLRLKETLERQGLFDPSKKVPIPRTPQRVGIVTSATGAALRDIMAVISRRAPGIQLLVCPARVQGNGAASEIAASLRLLDQQGHCDVIIVGRGGGSMEDLWEFNQEILARAIWDCKTPIISAVGHEIDFTISDFVADLRAATPSAAAEIVSQTSSELVRELAHLRARLDRSLQARLVPLQRLPELKRRLAQSLSGRLALSRQRLSLIQQRPAFLRPTELIDRRRQRLDEMQNRMETLLLSRLRTDQNQAERLQKSLNYLGTSLCRMAQTKVANSTERLVRAYERRLTSAKSKLEQLQAQCRALDPTAILKRGYAVVFQPDGKVLRTAQQTKDGDKLTIRLSDGTVPVIVTGDQSPKPKPAPRKTKPATQPAQKPQPADLFDE